jgi:hypothetical protein
VNKTGQLSINGNESRLDGGTLLARCGAGDPIGSGTAFLKNKGLEDGDTIWVTGQDGTVGDLAVFCMDDAGPQPPAAMPAEMKAVRAKSAPKKSKKKSPNVKKAKERPKKPVGRSRGKRT